MDKKDWYTCQDISLIDSPALLVYPDRVSANIQSAINITPSLERLRPHVKTFKCREVVHMLLKAGISKFKCATIAEAEMLALAGAKDIFLAYPLLGPKIYRFINLIKAYPQVRLSALMDDAEVMGAFHQVLLEEGLKCGVYLDINAGTNRTGVSPEMALELAQAAHSMSTISLVGLHLYDGHIRDLDMEKRKEKCDIGFHQVANLRDKLVENGFDNLDLMAGGTPTFPIHAARENVTCSPGTFPYWDKGYADTLPEQTYLFAAVLLTRVISLPSEGLICVDLGYKSVASESPLDKRISFFNDPDLIPLNHSEEHLVLQAPLGHFYKPGDVLYAIPYHICPTVALYEEVHSIRDNRLQGTWKNLARDRKINI